jgi:hypothetical protein
VVPCCAASKAYAVAVGVVMVGSGYIARLEASDPVTESPLESVIVTVTVKGEPAIEFGVQERLAWFPAMHPGGKWVQAYWYPPDPPEAEAENTTVCPTSRLEVELVGWDPDKDTDERTVTVVYDVTEPTPSWTVYVTV